LTTSHFAALGLADALQAAVSAEGYDTPTPIQTQAIPVVLDGHDVLGIAQTGTGKTAAFCLPLLHRLAESPNARRSRCVRVLVLAPTRELAVQIGASARAYGGRLRIRSAVVVGGVGMRPQIDALAPGLDILVATPGRLLDLVDGRHVDLGHVEAFVLDEADRMLDMGFIRDVQRIVRLLPKRRQSLLFSATMPEAVAGLAASILHKPVRVEVASPKSGTHAIEQRLYTVEQADKPSLLAELLRDPALARVIVFTRTKHGANRVAERLVKGGVVAEAIHGNKSQGARQRALEQFRSGAARVLVATDIAARGIDVDGVTHVVNFDLPDVPESYVHRIGRTARAGATGLAFSFCAPAEAGELRAIEALTKKPLERVEDHPYRSTAPARRPVASPGSRNGPRPNGNRPNGNRPNGNRPNGNRPAAAQPRTDDGRQRFGRN
jgi:ATP-dependent RNA helicase RhlE